MAEANTGEKTTEKGRPLGPTEVFYFAMTEQISASMYMHVAVIDSSHVLSPDDVRQAFRVLVSKQEAMQMRMEQTDEEDKLALCFVPCEDVDNFEMKVAQVKNVDDWVHLVNEENYIKIEALNGPLFKVIMATVEEFEKPDCNQENEQLNHKYIIILKIHHAIADAKSALDVMYRQFLPILSAVVNKGDPEAVMSFVPMCKPCEELFGRTDVKLPWYVRMGIGLLRWKNRTFGGPQTFVTRYPDDPDLQNMSEEEIKEMPICCPVRFGKDLTTQILRSAKNHGVSVHSVLLCACSVAQRATSQEVGVKVPSKMTMSWPIDLRRFLDQQTPLPFGAITGNGMSKINTDCDQNPEEFWKMCKETFEGIQKQTKRDTVIGPMAFGIINLIMDAIKKKRADEVIAEFGFAADGTVSNLGNCDLGPKPNMTSGDVTLHMSEEYFTVSGLATMCTMTMFNTVSTFEGQILWNTTYNKAYISNRFVKNFIGNVQEVCEKFCQ